MTEDTITLTRKAFERWAADRFDTPRYNGWWDEVVEESKRPDKIEAWGLLDGSGELIDCGVDQEDVERVAKRDGLKIVKLTEVDE